MTPERYSKVKEIFLAACDKPAEQRGGFVAQACGEDEEIKREVESLLVEHARESPLMPPEPEGPLGPMSAILSRAGIDVNAGAIKAAGDAGAGQGADTRLLGGRQGASGYLDDAHDQTSATRSGVVDAGRFMAGTVVASRYRIIELLGRGGMGEVYRADDITLSQSIALKFLPALFGSDQKWLERFRNEVRLARQVTHPNVCRVFDIDEYQGEQFISMEYVDGENLASLLRRIGRVPHDKAVLLARQLCAGLSAAHDKGVLHQDLKPANVMIDGRGAVRITDFGLAAPADQLKSDLIRAGTPAYMSPEQLVGKPVTVRSDVYSLGLVLYEMFTGRRVFKADNLREYQKLHSSEDPTPPSEIVDDIDPIVERVILRCLAKDPRDRPVSAMAVSAALPGGNPLREILAAGETPSPEVVAAAGEHGLMKPKMAIALLVAALACMIAFVSIAPRLMVVQLALNNVLRDGTVVRAEPAVMTYKSREILENLGYKDPPGDWAYGFNVNYGYYLHVENDQLGMDRLWRLARPRMGLVYFWYRQSPRTGDDSGALVPLRSEGVVREHDPPAGQPGMINVRLDPLGRLIGLEVEPTTPAQAVPAPETMPDAASTQPAARPAAPLKTNWSALLEAAGVDLKTFSPTTPQGTPPVYADERAAWSGYFPSVGRNEDRPGRPQGIRREPVRLEAAAYHGRPVYFAIIGGWEDKPLTEDRAEIKSVGQWNLSFQTMVMAALLVVGGVLAWKNHRSGRGYPKGAARMAVAFLLLGFVSWLLSAHHVPDPVLEFILFRRGMGMVLFAVFMMWIFYMALEPYVRRIWPETIISWNRLLEGKWFDPLVGRDILTGAAVGAITTLLALAEFYIPQWLGEKTMPVPLPSITSAVAMLHAAQSFSALFNSAIGALYFGLILLLGLVLIRMLVIRRGWTVVIAVALYAVGTAHYRQEQPWLLGPENILSLAVQSVLALALLALVTRHGLVALIFCLLVRAFLLNFPVTWNFSAWYAAASMAGILSTLILLGVGCFAALGGRTSLQVDS